MKHALPIFFFLFIFASCSNPEKLILGKWKFHHIDTETKASDSDALNKLAVAMNSMLAESYQEMYMEFYNTGECVIYQDWMSDGTKRPYYLTPDGKYIVTETEDVGEEKIEIVQIDNKELSIKRDGLTLVLVRE